MHHIPTDPGGDEEDWERVQQHLALQQQMAAQQQQMQHSLALHQHQQWCAQQRLCAQLATQQAAASAAPPGPYHHSLSSGPSRAPEAQPYSIIGHDLQVVQIVLQRGQQAVAETGSFRYSSDNVAVERLVPGGVLTTLSRFLAGESLFLMAFRNTSAAAAEAGAEAAAGPLPVDDGSGYVAFAAPHPGKIVPLDLRARGPVIAQADAFLCAVGQIEITPRLQSVEAGLFGGDIVLQRLAGSALCFIHAGGTVVEKQLLQGEALCVNAGCVAAYTESCAFRVEFVVSWVSAFQALAGRGPVGVKVIGPGVVWVQSLPLPRLRDRLMAAGGRSRRTDFLRSALGAVAVALLGAALFFTLLLLDHDEIQEL